MRTREKVFSVLAILSSMVGGAALVLLSVFDTKRYTTLHRVFLLFFMLGVWFAAVFSVVEVRYRRSVRFSFVDHTTSSTVGSRRTIRTRIGYDSRIRSRE